MATRAIAGFGQRLAARDVVGGRLGEGLRPAYARSTNAVHKTQEPTRIARIV